MVFKKTGSYTPYLGLAAPHAKWLGVCVCVGGCECSFQQCSAKFKPFKTSLMNNATEATATGWCVCVHAARAHTTWRPQQCIAFPKYRGVRKA